MNIKGSYKFKIPLKDGTIRTITGENLITFQGESFFLNRWINDEFNSIQYIVLGNSTNRPQKMDTKLGNETIRHNCVKTAYPEDKKIVLTSKFLASELLGTTEIGVCNDIVLISHDVYEKIKSTHIEGNIGEIEVEYTFQLTTSGIRDGWTQKSGDDYINYNIYYVDEPNEVISVYEENNSYGYARVYQLDSLKTKTGAFYYDLTLKKLYIRNSGDRNPNNDVILVQYK